MSSAELAARRTAAAAVLADFRAEQARTPLGKPVDSWSLRLAAELGGILAHLDALADDYPGITPEQAAEAATAFTAVMYSRPRIDGSIPAGPPEPGKLAAIRGVLDAIDWRHGNRQYTALAKIDQIAAGTRTASGPEAGGGAYLDRADLATVLAALTDAAEAKRDAADVCADCDAQPDGGLCGTCEWRLTLADEYDALAGRIGDSR